MEQLKFPVTKKEAEKLGTAYSSEANRNALFPSRLRALREEKGVSQAVLATALGVSKSTIGLYETGDTLPDVQTADMLANYFGISADYLLCRTDIRLPDPNMAVAFHRLGLTDTAAHTLLGIKKAEKEGKVEDIRLLTHTLNDFLSSHLIIAFLRNVQKYIRTAAGMANHNGPDDDENRGRSYTIDGLTFYDSDILDGRLRDIHRIITEMVNEMFMYGFRYKDIGDTGADADDSFSGK